MAKTISLKEIPIFRFIPSDRTECIMALFQRVEGRGHEVVFDHQATVSGIYVILEGQFEVLISGSDLPIATLQRGECVGEMSFVSDKSQKASAKVQCGPKGTTYIYASREALLEYFTKDSLFASNIYRGIADLTAERLKTTNRKITEQLEYGSQNLQNFMKQIEVTSKLDQTKTSLDETGFNIVNHLNEVNHQLTTLIEQSSDEAMKRNLTNIQDRITEVIMYDSQNFDRICQMLDQLNQHFANLKSLTRGGDVQEIKGDLTLFSSGTSSTS